MPSCGGAQPALVLSGCSAALNASDPAAIACQRYSAQPGCPGMTVPRFASDDGKLVIVWDAYRATWGITAAAYGDFACGGATKFAYRTSGAAWLGWSSRLSGFNASTAVQAACSA